MSLIGNLKLYSTQDAFLPSLSLSILYLSVQSFSAQMVVSLMRMVLTAFEMSTTWLAP